MQNEIGDLLIFIIGKSASKNPPICLQLFAGIVPAPLQDGGDQTRQAHMKKIEAVVKRSSLDDFHRCAKQLGIFGFDLSEDPPKRRGSQALPTPNEASPDPTSRIKVDFAVLDEETKPTVHAVLEYVHPDSVAIFKFDQDTQPQISMRRSSPAKP